MHTDFTPHSPQAGYTATIEITGTREDLSALYDLLNQAEPSDADGNTLRQRVFESVPVTRNRITTYQGQFFDGTEGNFTQSTFGFSVNGEWSGEDNYDF